MGKIDFIASDHAPHALKEKMGNYFKSMSGGPLVQHSLLALLELFHTDELSLNEIVKLTSHNVAEAYRMVNRGYLKEGYYADAVLVDLNDNFEVTPQNILYKCGWSPFSGYDFKSKIIGTWVNGQLVYDASSPLTPINKSGMRLQFKKDR